MNNHSNESKKPRTENRVELDSTRTADKPILSNAHPSILSTDVGIKMDSKEEQFAKASASTTFEIASNSIELIHPHP
jgi:hypothetical protein